MGLNTPQLRLRRCRDGLWAKLSERAVECLAVVATALDDVRRAVGAVVAPGTLNDNSATILSLLWPWRTIWLRSPGHCGRAWDLRAEQNLLKILFQSAHPAAVAHLLTDLRGDQRAGRDRPPRCGHSTVPVEICGIEQLFLGIEPALQSSRKYVLPIPFSTLPPHIQQVPAGGTSSIRGPRFARSRVELLLRIFGVCGA